MWVPLPRSPRPVRRRGGAGLGGALCLAAAALVVAVLAPYGAFVGHGAPRGREPGVACRVRGSLPTVDKEFAEDLRQKMKGAGKEELKQLKEAACEMRFNQRFDVWRMNEPSKQRVSNYKHQIKQVALAQAQIRIKEEQELEAKYNALDVPEKMMSDWWSEQREEQAKNQYGSMPPGYNGRNRKRNTFKKKYAAYYHGKHIFTKVKYDYHYQGIQGEHPFYAELKEKDRKKAEAKAAEAKEADAA